MYYSAIGDHLGADGNSYVYTYDPASGSLTQIVDVLELTDHNSGAWGYGKVHAQMALGPCDEIFFTTYWGSRRGLTYENGYEGDLLFHIDPYGQHGRQSRGARCAAGIPDYGRVLRIMD